MAKPWLASHREIQLMRAVQCQYVWSPQNQQTLSLWSFTSSITDYSSHRSLDRFYCFNFLLDMLICLISSLWG